MTPVWLIPALIYLCFVQGQSPCTTPDGKSGDCKSILECEPLRAKVNKPARTQEEENILKNSACGFDGDIPKVCCPTQAAQKSCVTPEGNPGQCINILECDHITKRLQSPTVSQEDRAYVNSIRCEGPGFMVCCAHSTAPPGPATVPTGRCTSSAAPPDPRTECCGVDGTSNKITGGNATGIDQYPWLALIEYKNDDQITLLCGGVLISGRYVLTAGHCVVGPGLSGTPTNVRLGEYDTANPSRDCVAVEGGNEGQVDCADKPVVIPIERVIPHPDYNPQQSKRNDLAMLRLQSLVPYTDFVRPICLPTTDITVNFPATEKLFAAGWGAVSEKKSSSNIKLHVDLPYKSIEACQLAYTASNRRVKLWSGQICAGGEPGKDSCKGDSGGPLMFSTGTTYEVVGIVSFGPTPCGLVNLPGVYTKVFKYMTWIRSNIQP